MASTIKGITVKIAGETTDLQKALKNIQSSSRSLQAELKTINSQLKFDPDNTVLLTQKQDVLREQIKSSTSALQELNEVKEQVEEQAKNGEISADQFRAYQREVEKTKSQLENFEKQLADTEFNSLLYKILIETNEDKLSQNNASESSMWESELKKA